MSAATAALPAADEPVQKRFCYFCDRPGEAMKPKRRTSGRGRARVAFVRCQRTQPEKRREGQRGNISSGEVYKKYFGSVVLKKRSALLGPATTPWWACDDCGKDNLQLLKAAEKKEKEEVALAAAGRANLGGAPPSPGQLTHADADASPDFDQVAHSSCCCCSCCRCSCCCCCCCCFCCCCYSLLTHV